FKRSYMASGGRQPPDGTRHIARPAALPENPNSGWGRDEANIEHPTSNGACVYAFKVGCWMLDVRPSAGISACPAVPSIGGIYPKTVNQDHRSIRAIRGLTPPARLMQSGELAS